MGDLLGSPRVVPLVLLFSIIFLQLLLLLFFFFGPGEGKALLRRARSGHLAKMGDQIFGLKIRPLDLQAHAFPSLLYTKTVFKEFSAHSIAFNRCVVCFILLGGTCTRLSTRSHHFACQFS
jgi:hypothetical protein